MEPRTPQQRGERGPGARVIPLAVLLAVLGASIATRTRRVPKRIEAASPWTAHLLETSNASIPSKLGAPLPVTPARVVERSGRMIHEDPHHTHRAHGHAPSRAELLWKLETDGPIESQVAASADQQTLYVATLGGSLWAVTRQGERSFSVPLGGRGYGSPLVAEDGTIYVGSDAGFFFAISPPGHIRWKLETGGEADTGAILLPNGNVAFGAGSAVFAVRPSGDVVWRFGAKGKVFTSPAVTDDGVIVFGSQDGHAYALTPQGTLAWAAYLGGDVDGAPAIGDDGGVFVGTDRGDVVRLGAHGEIVWRADVGGFVRGALSVARNGDVLAGVYGPLPRQVRVTQDGALRGAFGVQGTGALEFGVHGGALEDDEGTLVFGAQDDRVYAVGTGGKLLWDFLTGGDVDAPLTLLADGILIAGSDDGSLYALGDAPPK
jgi:outer membrane protein assembly factor BamB